MKEFRIEEDLVFSDCRASNGNGVIGIQVNLFIFDFSPQPFYEYIIPPGSSSIYTRQVIASNHR
jgi:hypothetical protein